nr:hypothetical protein [Candidatus Njordarchaeota archaeon]
MNESTRERSRRRRTLSIALVFMTLLLVTPTLLLSASAVALPPPPPGWNFGATGGWDKIVDLAPLASNYISHVKTTFGIDLPGIPQDIHVWIYSVYINQSNTQTFYAGFINFTSSVTNFTMPEQLLIHHFTTRNGNDAIFAASFTMLAVFNQTDEMYGSFTLGKQDVLDTLRAYDSTVPASITSRASVLPFSHSSGNNTWSWGMKYENLTTMWWRIFPSNGSYTGSPFAVMLFDELTFKYNMTIVPATSASPMGSITTRADYVIGNVSHLWYVKNYPNNIEYFNSTTTTSTHDFLANMKISILQHQKTSVYGKPVSVTSNSANVRNASADVSASGFNETVGNELVSSTDFGTKRNYTLYSTGAGTVWPTTTKTYPFKGLVDNSIFNDTQGIYAAVHRVASFVPQFFDPKGRGFDVTITDTDAVFMISYPQWEGYRIVHDPYFAVFTSTSGQGGPSGLSGAFMILIAGAALVVVTSVVVIHTRARKRGT